MFPQTLKFYITGQICKVLSRNYFGPTGGGHIYIFPATVPVFLGNFPHL